MHNAAMSVRRALISVRERCILRRATALLVASLLSAIVAAVVPSSWALAQCPASVPSEGATLPGPLPLFPSNNWWNTDISSAPVDSGSAGYINFVNNGGTRHLHPDFGGEVSPGSVEIYGFPYAVVDGGQAKQAVTFDYWDESDGVNYATHQGIPFYPIPDQAITGAHWIESGDPGNVDLRSQSDRHLLLIDCTNRYLYELYNVFYDSSVTSGPKWQAGSGAFFDMNTNNRRPDTWTSADAAGLAIFPGLVRYDEAWNAAVTDIGHAFRVTVRSTNGYVYPASHVAGTTSGALPMGARLRLKANVGGLDPALRSSDPHMQKIFRAMQKYGLIVADNGSDMYISGTFDTNWDNDILNPALSQLTASDFDVVQLGWTPSPAGPTLNIVSGNTQGARVGTAFAQALVVQAKDAGGNPVSGSTVVWTVPTLGPGAILGSANSVTDANGYATTSVSANAISGSYAVTAQLGPLSAIFNLTNTTTIAAGTACSGNTATNSDLIEQYYAAILRRASDAGGKAFWGSEADRLCALGADPKQTFFLLANTFFNSPEYLAFNRDDQGFVTDLYVTFFNRLPDSGGMSYWLGQIATGMPRNIVMSSFLFSPEFTATMNTVFPGKSARAETYLTLDLFGGFFRRLADSGGYTYWDGQFLIAQCQGNAAAAVQSTIDVVSSQFVSSAEYVTRNTTNSQYVEDLYYAILQRGGDLAGFDFWTGQIASGAQSRSQVRMQFLASPEMQSQSAAIAAQGCLP
jgi:Domain of unknown function (DUF4214)/Bacterial Ig-like domain (group 1)